MDRAKILSKARILWNYMVLNEPVKKADIVLCLGSHDTNVAHRAAELIKLDVAPFVIITGGHGKITAGDKQSEAEKFAQIIQLHGFRKWRIFMEEKATNTGENFQFSKELIKEKGLNVKTIAVVTKPCAERRVKAAFEKQMPEFTGFVTSPRKSFDWYVSEYYKTDEEIMQMVGLLIGDIYKFDSYAKKGYQVPVQVPYEIMQICHCLEIEGGVKPL